MRAKLLVVVIIVVLAISVVVFLNSRQRDTLTEGQGTTQEKAVSSSQVLSQAVKEEGKGNLLKARDLYNKLVSDFPNLAKVSAWQKKIGELSINLLFSSTITPSDILYEIKAGDSLDKIARKFKTTIELLKKSNNLSSDVIITGRKLKVCTKTFNIVVDKSRNILLLKSNDEVVKLYVVATGLNNSTPVGTFKIVNKLVRPPWFKAGAVVPADSPDNILGSRWMGFDLKGFGIHGTTQPETLGQQITHGCVRMSNSEVEELFAIVPVKTEVTIVN